MDSDVVVCGVMVVDISDGDGIGIAVLTLQTCALPRPA